MVSLRALAWAPLALAALGVSACGAAPAAVAGPLHDAPVPASEPRAEVRLRVDLTPAEGCEEAFDLALYRDRGVDLIAWDERAGACAGRVVTIRYLPRRMHEAALLAAVRRLAREVVSLPAAPPSPGGPR
ncbi:MAG: hypothetical protein IT372_31755 [Polyangiaceae bacterium]|nr:hypothetical protein [Polyangiaceae bacterium]